VRLRQESNGVGGDESFSVTDADDEWALAARSDDQLRVVAVNHDEGEVPLDLAIGAAHRLDQVALVVALDQMGNGLGVGLGIEVVGPPRSVRRAIRGSSR